jgi:glycosyltransferase involved in cell wall biosynthesis
MINDEHFPSKGADTVNVIRTAAALGEAGADVNLIIPKLWENNMTYEELCKYYGVGHTFKLTRIPTIAPPSRTVRFEKLTHSMAAPLLSIIEKTDIVYSRNLIPLALANIAKKPWVFETYRRFAEETPWLAQMTRFLPLKNALAAVTHADMSRDSLEALGFEKEAILTAHSGYMEREVLPRIDKMQARRECNLDIEGKVVLLLGNIDPYVRLDWLLATSKELPHVTFVFVGGGKEQQDYWKNKCSEQGIKNTVFIENQPPAKVRQFLYTADVLAVVPRNADLEQDKMGIFPSLYKVLPGIPMKLFIYKAVGIPIFCPDVQYVQEILKHHKNAFLAPLEPPDKVTEVLAEALENKELRKKVVSCALRESKSKTWNDRGKSILDFLKQRLSVRGWN